MASLVSCCGVVVAFVLPNRLRKTTLCKRKLLLQKGRTNFSSVVLLLWDTSVPYCAAALPVLHFLFPDDGRKM